MDCGGGSIAEREKHIPRLLKVSEAKRLVNASPYPGFKYFTPPYLDLYTYGSDGAITTITSANLTANCQYGGATAGYCHPGIIHLLDGHLQWDVTKDGYGNLRYGLNPRVNSSKTTLTGTPICVYEIRNWFPYGGAGGLKGNEEEYTFSVLPNDTLELTVGKGGDGGAAGFKGTQGGVTKVVHKRGGAILQTYQAQGGLGGQGAASSGPAIGASELFGGEGAGGTKGADADTSAQDAEANSSGGGGGGFCPRSARSGSSCSKGGKGASGKIELTYDIITPGGGGGAGASANEIEYKVTPGERIVFTIGKGGDAGGSNMIGKAGNKTTVMENHIIFNPGLGGGFGVGGSGGVLQINSSKAKLPVVSGVAAANIGKGQNGGNGKMLPNKNFGFDGGIGGMTFLNYFGGCGGGIIEDENAERLCQTSSRADGMEAKSHNAVKDEFGGQGGGGGGVTMSNSTLGAGGAGSDGYLRIRWGD